MANHPFGHQTLTATLILSGPQDVVINTHGTGGHGSHISVTTATLMLSMHDRVAARTYVAAWEDTLGAAHLQLGPYRGISIEPLSARMPAVVVRAYGTDEVSCVVNHRRELQLRIGYLTFMVLDRDAHLSFTDAFRTVRTLASLVLPLHNSNPNR